MASVQTLRTPGGEELVVLSRQDYDALVALAADAEEDDDDVAIYDARKTQTEASGESPLPGPVGAALLKGDSLLKAIRRWRGLSQRAVAERSGIGQGYLSDLERRRRAGAPDTLEKLASVLDVPVAWLTPPAVAAS